MKITKRIAVLASSRAFINSHQHLIKSLVQLGHRVFCVVPEDGFDCNNENFGAEFHALPLQRTGFNPLNDLKFLGRLVMLFKRLKIDMTIAYTIKPVIYGSIAARIVRTPFISSVITGLGYAFINESLQQKMAGFMALNLYRLAMAYNQRVFFLNPDDREDFLRLNVVKPEQCAIINGSGVDLKHFSFSPTEQLKPSFVLISRMLKEKGIMEFIEAARIVKQTHPEVKFNIVGPQDPGPSGISPAEIEMHCKDGLIAYHGATDDVRPYLRDSAVYILPSYYREGIPRTNLEAMATGRAIITTNTPGCRETVVDGENGYLVPPKDSQALADAMLKFIHDSALVREMGRASRRLAEKSFAVDEVNQSMMSYLNLLES
jgi:glycosyltransferase involved in cell wall biosynthesis